MIAIFVWEMRRIFRDLGNGGTHVMSRKLRFSSSPLHLANRFKSVSESAPYSILTGPMYDLYDSILLKQ